MITLFEHTEDTSLFTTRGGGGGGGEGCTMFYQCSSQHEKIVDKTQKIT